MRCSTTDSARTTGLRSSAPSPSSVGMTTRSVTYTVKESVCTGACEAESVCFSEAMRAGKPYLWDESVGQRKTQDASHKSSATQEEKVPVETTWLLQGELSGLCADTADVLEIWSAIIAFGRNRFDLRGRSRREA